MGIQKERTFLYIVLQATLQTERIKSTYHITTIEFCHNCNQTKGFVKTSTRGAFFQKDRIWKAATAHSCTPPLLFLRKSVEIISNLQLEDSTSRILSNNQKWHLSTKHKIADSMESPKTNQLLSTLLKLQK